MEFESCACGMEPWAPLTESSRKSCQVLVRVGRRASKGEALARVILIFHSSSPFLLPPLLTVKPGTNHPNLGVLVFSLKTEVIELNL